MPDVSGRRREVGTPTPGRFAVETRAPGTIELSGTTEAEPLTVKELDRARQTHGTAGADSAHGYYELMDKVFETAEANIEDPEALKDLQQARAAHGTTEADSTDGYYQQMDKVFTAARAGAVEPEGDRRERALAECAETIGADAGIDAAEIVNFHDAVQFDEPGSKLWEKSTRLWAEHILVLPVEDVRGFDARMRAAAAPHADHRSVARAAILSSTPEERAYYAANDRKHFGDVTNPGSQFTAAADTEALVTLASQQRGGLDGDDREALIARGGDPAGFMDGKRYLLVQTPGVLGIKSGAEVSDDTPVTVTRTKPGAPCSMVASVAEKTPVDYGVVVMGTHNVSGDPFLISTFPGRVTRPTADERVDALEGQTVPAGQLRALLGEQEFNAMTLNTVIQREPAAVLSAAVGTEKDPYTIPRTEAMNDRGQVEVLLDADDVMESLDRKGYDTDGMNLDDYDEIYADATLTGSTELDIWGVKDGKESVIALGVDDEHLVNPDASEYLNYRGSFTDPVPAHREACRAWDAARLQAAQNLLDDSGIQVEVKASHPSDITLRRGDRTLAVKDDVYRAGGAPLIETRNWHKAKPEDLNEFLGGEPEQDVTKMLILSARLSAAAKLKAQRKENR